MTEDNSQAMSGEQGRQFEELCSTLLRGSGFTVLRRHLVVDELGIEEGVWSDLLQGRDVIHLGNDASIKITALKGGMTSGLPSVAMCFDLPDGRVVLAETSLRLFRTAAAALEGWRVREGQPE